MITVQQIIDYLSEHISDPVPKYILIKEIYKKDPSSLEYARLNNTAKIDLLKIVTVKLVKTFKSKIFI